MVCFDDGGFGYKMANFRNQQVLLSVFVCGGGVGGGVGGVGGVGWGKGVMRVHSKTGSGTLRCLV